MAVIVYSGQRLIIEFAQLANGQSPAKQFFDTLRPQEQNRLMVTFKRLGDDGRVTNREHFKKFDGDFWEVKNFQARMLCYFRNDGRVVVTHGFIKKKDSADPSELARAKSIREQHQRLNLGS